MKKRLFRLFTAFLMCVILSGGTGAAQTYAHSVAPEGNTEAIIQPKADILEWQYKIINGKLYKRLYNFTQEVWVGEWILVN